MIFYFSPTQSTAKYVVAQRPLGTLEEEKIKKGLNMQERFVRLGI